jgi:acetate---CoA ligase (ADP-forming)
VAEWRLADTPEEAAAAELGGPVALKAVAPGLVHKTEAGAVRLGIDGAEAVRAMATEMAETVAARGFPEGFLVQRMVPDGVELLVGVVHDASFGPVVACGAGGTAVELLKDVAVRITPLTDRDAAEMIRSLQAFPLLDGYRGAPRADVAALEELLLRVSALVVGQARVIPDSDLGDHPPGLSRHPGPPFRARPRVQSTGAPNHLGSWPSSSC